MKGRCFLLSRTRFPAFRRGCLFASKALPVQSSPHFRFIAFRHVLRGHEDTVVSTAVVPFYQSRQEGQVAVCPLDREVPIQAWFQPTIEPFHHQGFISCVEKCRMCRKMPDALTGQPASEGGIVEFFAYVCVQSGRTTSPRRVVGSVRELPLQLCPSALRRGYPCLLGQDVDRRQQVPRPPIPAPHRPPFARLRGTPGPATWGIDDGRENSRCYANCLPNSSSASFRSVLALEGNDPRLPTTHSRRGFCVSTYLGGAPMS